MTLIQPTVLWYPGWRLLLRLRRLGNEVHVINYNNRDAWPGEPRKPGGRGDRTQPFFKAKGFPVPAAMMKETPTWVSG